MADDPKVIVEASPTGVSGITVRFGKGQRADGLALLERALPAIRQLDQSTRHEPQQDPRQAQGTGKPLRAG